VEEVPETRYANTADGVRIAYQVTGDGPVDVIIRSPITIPIDLLWEEPSVVRFAKRLGTFSRTVWFEPRGIGASGGNYWDAWETDAIVADHQAVLDAAGCECVVLLGTTGGGPMTIRLCALVPNRVSALVLVNSFAHYVREDDYSIGFPPDTLESFTGPAGELWGLGTALEVMAPSRAGDQAFRAWFARGQRLGLAPDMAVMGMRAAYRQDVRQLLPTLAMPTLVLHRRGDRHIRVEAGRYLAEHIPGARYVELPGEDHVESGA